MTSFIHDPEQDTWAWNKAKYEEVEEILDLIAANYEMEVAGILSGSRPRMALHLYKALLTQAFEPWSNLVLTCRDKTSNKLLAWSWLERGKYTPFAPEEMSCAEFLHIDLSVSLRNRMTLTAQCINLWEAWSRDCGIPVITSTTIRQEQRGFLRLHEKLGYTVRGSIAYKRLSTTPTTNSKGEISES